MSRLATWVTGNPIAALSLGGLVLYADVRLAYALFYDRLGVTPEEIGLGYQQAIAQSALAFVLIIVLFAAYAVVLAAVSAAYFRLLTRGAASTRRRSAASARNRERVYRWEVERASAPERSTRLKASILASLSLASARIDRAVGRGLAAPWRNPRVLLPSIVFAFAIATLGYVIVAIDSANLVRQGHALRSQDLFGVPFLGIRAQPASVSFPRGTKPSVFGRAATVLYLGQSGGTSFFYVYAASRRLGRTVRVPSSAIAVSTPVVRPTR